MAIAETAKLVSSLTLDTSGFDKGIGKATASLGKLSSGVAKSRAVAVGLGVGLERVAEKGLSVLGGAIADGIQGALTLEKAQAQTQAVITSTGAAAGVTAQQVRDLANSLEDVTTVDDKTIQQGENLLLTFTAIGKDIFPQVTKAAVDMAVALNKGDAATADIDASSIRLGKALQDPLKGLTALQRVGVNTSQLKPQIEALFGLTKEETKHWQEVAKGNKKAGDAYLANLKVIKTQKAQKLILAELEKEFGKAGAAAGTGFQADINRANDAIEDAKISIAQGLMPALGEVARELAKTFKDPQVIQGLKDLGTGIGDVIKGGVAFAKTVPWGAIADSLRTAAGFAKDLLSAFLGLPTWVQTAVITGWGLNKLTGGALTDIFGTLASGLIKGVLGMNAGVVNINAGVVNGGAGLGGGAAAGGAGLLSTVAGLAVPVTIAAVAASAATQLANADLQSKGIGGSFATPGSSGSNPLFAVLPFGIGASLQNIATSVGIISSNTANVATGGDIEALRGVIAAQPGKGLGGPGPSTISGMESRRGAMGDALFAAEFKTIAKSGDIEALRGTIAADLAPVASSTDIEVLRGDIGQGLQMVDTSTVAAGSLAANTARSAGLMAANASRAAGAGIESTLWATRPIVNVNVDVSATTINQVSVTQDRAGAASGSRNGDGAGFGPAGR